MTLMNMLWLGAAALALSVVVGAVVALMGRSRRQSAPAPVLEPSAPATPVPARPGPSAQAQPDTVFADTQPPAHAAPVASAPVAPAGSSPASLVAQQQAAVQALREARRRAADEAARLQAERQAHQAAESQALAQAQRQAQALAAARQHRPEPAAPVPPRAVPTAPVPATAATPAIPPTVPFVPPVVARQAPAGTGLPPLVLVVDDSKVVRIKTSRLLEKHGFRVALADDGLTALDSLVSELPDLVITDVEMPGLDGFGLCQRLRSSSAWQHLPVVMITSSDEKHQSQARSVGVNVLLGKPYEEDDLVARVRGALQPRRRAALH